MSTLQDALVRLAVAKAIADQAAKATEAGKLVVKGEVGGRMGATGAVLPDGTEGATVSISKPTVKKGGELYVHDRAAFTKWCIENRPDAIEQVVRGTSEAAILAAARKSGDMPDGVEVTNPSTSGGGSVIVRQTPEQLANLVRNWRAGDLLINVELPVIEEADDGEA